MSKQDSINLTRLELLIRGAEPEGNNEIAFVRCYAGAILNEPLMDIAKGLREKLDINNLSTLDWQYLFIGLIMGDKDYRDSIEEKTDEPIH